MKKLYTGFLAVCICAASFQSFAQQSSKFSQVKINAKGSNLASLQQKGLDFDHAYYDEQAQAITVTLEAKDIRKLRDAGVGFDITIDDEEQDFLKRNDPKDFFKYDKSRRTTAEADRLLFTTPDKSFANTLATPAAFNPGSMGGYLTFAEMKKELDSMVWNYPDLVRLDSIGRTYENRAIWALSITNPASAAQNKPRILYTGMHHAREPLAMVNLIFFMQYLLENYSINAGIRQIVDSRELVFIPCLNPDGYVYNQNTNPSGGGLWRKNRQPNSNGSLGQDLNRNYGYGFNYPNNGSSSVTTDQTYHGDFAFQANETQIVKQFLRDKNFKFALNYHSYGGYWIHGNTVPSYTLSRTDSVIIKTTRAIGTRHSIYKAGTPIETVGYNGNGTSEDWFLMGDAAIRPAVYSASPELGLGLTTFWPAASSIIGYCKDVFFGNLQVALFGGSYVDVDDKGSMALTATSGNLAFTVRRIGQVDSAITLTVLPLENIDSVGAPVVIANLPTYLATATANISYKLSAGLLNGQRIRFVLKTETGGITKLDTVSKFFNPTVLFTDDMESGTVSKNGTKWSSTTWGYTTASAYGGTRSLSESPAGTYSANSTRTVNTVSNFNLSDATFAYLSFWTRYNSQNGYDKLQVKVSTDGANYTALPGIHTVTESKGTLGGAPSLTGYQDYWVREIVDLKSVIGLGATAVRIRFEFSSDGSTNDEGFFIDDVQLIKSTVAANAPRMSALTVQATKADDNVVIGWASVANADHEYFEVERSADGKTFSPIHKTTGKAQYQTATDQSPLNGSNYYRIKASSRTGAQYSKAVAVFFNDNRTVKLYPNPASEEMQVETNGLPAGRYGLQVINLSGHVVGYKQVEMSKGFNKFSLTMTGFVPGQYRLCLRNEKGEPVDVKTFVKL